MNDLCSLAVCLRLLLCCSDVEGQLLSMLHVPRQRSGSVTLSPRPKAPTVDLSLALPLIAEGASAVLDDSFTHCFEVRMLFSASPVFLRSPLLWWFSVTPACAVELECVLVSILVGRPVHPLPDPLPAPPPWADRGLAAVLHFLPGR